MARHPAASAPMQADMEECSLSTVMNSVSTLPSATYWAEILGDLGGGGDGERGEHVRVDLAHGVGDGLIAGQSLSNAHVFIVLLP